VIERRLTPQRWIAWIAVMAALLVAVGLVCSAIGPAPADARGAGVTAWLSKIVRLDLSDGEADILNVRLIRLAAAAVIGFALAAAGVVFQAILRNPLADPFILGVSGGGALGAAVGIVLGVGAWSLRGVSPLPLCAFAGSLGAVAIVYSLSLAGRASSTYVLLLVGVVCNALFAAAIMFLMSMAENEQLQQIAFWLMGSISAALLRWRDVAAAGVLVVGGALGLIAMARSLNLMSLGEETAARLGANVQRTRRLCFVLASLITGAAVSISGLIGFVGLIVPHALRLLLGPDHRLLLPASALGGAIFLMVADTIVRAAFPLGQTQLPVGVITALCGGPFFILLLHRRSGRIFVE
jgi:iron complex transport system permease protein